MEQKSTSRYILTALAVILVVTSFILVALNALELDKRWKIGLPDSMTAASDAREGYVEGYLAAREKYSRICVTNPSGGLGLAGTVESNDGKILKVRQQSFDTDPFVDGVSDVRTVTIDAKTVVRRQTTKSPEELQKEFETFKPAPASAETLPPPEPPRPVGYATISLKDIKNGQRVFVEADGDLRTADNIVAKTITVFE